MQDRSNIQFTVITTSYNDEKEIEQYYRNMMRQTIQPQQYILVDGGSADNTVKTAERFAAEESLNIHIDKGRRLNIAQGYNEAVKLSKTDVVILTGIGNCYDVSFFEELILAYLQTGCSILYGRIKGQNNNFFSKNYNSAFLNGERGKNIGLPSNRGVLIEKDVFHRVGFFYEKFVYAGEDTEFFRLAVSKGEKVGYCKEAVIYWKTPMNFAEFFKQQQNYYIGFLQHTGGGIGKKALLLLAVILVPSALCVGLRTSVFLGGYFVIYLMIGAIIRSFHPLAVLLWILSTISPIWLYPGNKKYDSKEFKVRRKE